ncbi:MAG: hypothetical protein H0W58_06820 [Acidobacteria bacterium]|jgi:hypothetical protein|nr:hypothetical protein [Acidobacteriota bacterium]
MKDSETQNLAERIAHLLQENGGDDFSALRSSIEKINERLTKIEAELDYQNPQSATRNLQSFHSSQEKFAVAEIVADEIIKGLEQEKACPYEPTGKPCDHCAMCSSRGF